MKKLLEILILGLLWCNVGFAADYLKIPIIKELLKSKNNLDYECYYPDGKHAGSFRIDMKNKIVNETHVFDKSSNKNLIKIYVMPPDSSSRLVDVGFFTFNVTKRTLLLQEVQNVDRQLQNIKKLINDNDLFKIIKNGVSRSLEQKCGATIFWKIKKMQETDFQELLDQAKKESGKGIEVVKGEYNKEIYIGEYVNGDWTGQGIYINAELPESGFVYIGELVEGFREGRGTIIYNAWQAYTEDRPEYRDGLIISGDWKEDELEKEISRKKL